MANERKTESEKKKTRSEIEKNKADRHKARGRNSVTVCLNTQKSKEGRTYGRTNGRTDGRTDTVTYRVACTRLKRKVLEREESEQRKRKAGFRPVRC